MGLGVDNFSRFSRFHTRSYARLLMDVEAKSGVRVDPRYFKEHLDCMTDSEYANFVFMLYEPVDVDVDLSFEDYMTFIRDTCKKSDYKKDWSHGGCYMHLEVSEFIEALRGKGDPTEELGDVLFTVLAVADHYKIDIGDAMKKCVSKHKLRLETVNNG